MIDKLETVTILLLMPLFFALTGVRTNLIFTSGSGSYFDFGLILLVAIGGKWGGTLIGARASGMGWSDSCQLGLMMNTRGLVELIVLNVGLDTGILSPPLFSMMVCMALVTTAMTMPLMDWWNAESCVRRSTPQADCSRLSSLRLSPCGRSSARPGRRWSGAD